MNQNQKGVSRRQFLGTGLAAAAAITIIPRHVLGGNGFIAASDQVVLGFIGTGKQARYLVTEFAKRGKVIAGCDVYARKLAQFKYELERREYSTEGFVSYTDFRELLNNKDIDAVVIATPDHWHAMCVIEAAKAGKDVYCEKPYSHSINEGRLMVQAIDKYKRVNQTGNMQRSWKEFQTACNIVRNGYIGEVKEVKVDVGGPPKAYDLPEQTIPEGLNWDMWIGPAVFNKFNAELAPPLENNNWANWRNYKEYGNGMTSDWGAHMFDIAQWGLGMDDSGPVAIYPPDADHQFLTFEYANGIKMTHERFGRGNSVRFIGTKGTVDVTRGRIESTPAELVNRTFTEREKITDVTDHYQNWIDCIRSRKQPLCTAEIGHRTASICYLTNIAYELKRPLKWNPKTEKFVNDAEADKLTVGHLRAPWKMQI